MHMTFHYDTKILFFFDEWLIKDNTFLFALALFLTAVFAAFVSIILFKAHLQRYLIIAEPLIEFLAMYVIMSYNFWVFVTYIIGRTIGHGYVIYARKLDKLSGR